MNVKKFTSYAVALMMSFSLAPINANALTTDNAVTKGYYNDSGQWVQGELDQTLPEGIHSVDKTAEALGNNTYKMKLKVVTKQKVETFTKKSATVLVVDTSGSMENTSGSTLKKRIQNLKEAANEFVKSYAGDKENVGRYLAIADFSSGVKVALNWTDVSSKDGKNNAFTAISKLKADGGTNLDAGIKQATSLFLKDAVKQIQKDNRNTVVLTDGTPTYYLEDCEGGWDTFLHTHVTIDGITYDLAGDGRKGSEKNVEATSKDAKLLKDQSTVYTVCYGAATDKTYKNGPTVSEFLKGSIATSRDKAYDSSETDDLTEVFKAISESVTTGITGKDLEVFDGSAPYVSVSQLPASVQQDTSGFKWKLANATTTTEGTQTYYTYELEYIVTLDADHPEFEEGKLYPLNGETYIAMPDGSKVKFPVPGAKGIKSRYTVTYTDGVDGEVVFEDKVFNNLVVGTPTPDFGETPTRAGYTFKGWTPAIEEKVTKDITYNATWVMNWVPMNAAPVIKATDKTIEVGDEFDPRADVTAEDVEDGDLTDKIEILKNDVNVNEPGIYDVTYKVTDTQGASYTTTIKVTVNPKAAVLNACPVIKATDKVLTVGDTFDERADVTAEDEEDGDITDKIEVLKNEVDTTKPGKYEVTYKVTDSGGASYVKTIKVTVNPKMEPLNAAPIIKAEDKTLTVGDTFDERADVTATDAEDGDLTDKIEVLKNEVDTTKAGKYEVTYKVTDSKGASRTKTITVTVNPKMEPLNEAPTIDVTDKEITVGDKFDPKDGVTAKDKEDGNLTDKIEILKNTVDPSKPGVYEVTYKVTDSKGASCTKTIKVTVKEKTPAPSKNNDKTTTVTPKTGDSTNVSAVIALLAVSGIALLALLKKKKLS
ncbi:immunoglobulin-like domain-containing protein [uncultured Catenibacterium sp.]|uniref:immunoglobulin-like domain-containing protein n=1 Tax=uncultured Catenibacterium sp. TaxID=286142 RepID=UPI0025EF00AC|nr:immunoglobulin-like domain-containing protein [uncultured Catenibacterium sp.]